MDSSPKEALPAQTSSNHLFIKSVSPLATERSVTEFFRQASLINPNGEKSVEGSPTTAERTVADDVNCVEFVKYPGSMQRYCRINFKSSSGVTSAMSLNTHLLHGVPTSMSVIDPAKSAESASFLSLSLHATAGLSSIPSQNPLVQALTPATVQALIKETQAIHTNAPVSQTIQAFKALFMTIANVSSEQANGLVACASAAANVAHDAAVGLPATTANILLAISKAASAMTGGNIDIIAAMASATLPRESEEHQIARTLYVGGLPEDWDTVALCSFLADDCGLGKIKDSRVDTIRSSGVRFALVEFSEAATVEYACSLPAERRRIPNDSNIELEFDRAKTTVRAREPENVSFNLAQVVLPPVPIAYQSVNQLSLDQKLQEARSRATRLVANRTSKEGRAAEQEEEHQERGDSPRDFRRRRHSDNWRHRSAPYHHRDRAHHSRWREDDRVHHWSRSDRRRSTRSDYHDQDSYSRSRR